MNSRERQLAVICHQVPDRVPVDAICIENSRQIADFLAMAPEAVCDRLGIDGRIVAAPYTGACPAELSEWGTRNTGDYGTGHDYPLAAVTSIREVERYAWPDPVHYDYPAAAGTATALGDRYAVRGPYWKPLFCQACDLFGMEEAMARMLTEPEIFEAALDAILAHTLLYCEALLDACGDTMPILCLGDDFATQRGLMISPEQWRAFLKPRYAQLFDVGKRREKFIWFHSCGDVTAVLPDLIDIGVDVWETVQLHTLPMTPSDLKREYGAHLTFFGGVSTQHLPFATPTEICDETIHCIELLGHDGGYICGPDHHIKPDVPPANAVALFDTATGFRGEGITQPA
ncbi:MAG: uroporphyrinogen decarboxylase family protein [Armatimonadota bacterium]